MEALIIAFIFVTGMGSMGEVLGPHQGEHNAQVEQSE